MKLVNLFKKIVFNHSDFHFMPMIGKKRALLAINKARLVNCGNIRNLNIIACDLQNIAVNGYVSQNKVGFHYDYSEFV